MTAMANPNRVRAVPPRAGLPKKLTHSKGGHKLDKRLIMQIADLVREGVGVDSALNYLGITPDKFWKWMRKGDLYLKGGGLSQPDQKHAIYGEFVVELRKANAEYIVDRTRELRGANWYRAMSILERKDRKNWQRKEPMGGSLENYDPDEKFL